MKRKILPIALLAMLALGCSAKASAQDISIDETNFPDPGLREYVQTAYDTNKDGVLSDEENKNAKKMNAYFNADPNLIVTIQEEPTYDYYNLAAWKVRSEFPCSQIAEHPLSEVVPTVSSHYVYYVVGVYPWEHVINSGVKNWKGLELLTSLKEITVGGALSQDCVLTGSKSITSISIGGVTSEFENFTVRNCPNLIFFDFAPTRKLKKINLSKVSKTLCQLWQSEFNNSSVAGKRKRVEIIVGDAPKLKQIQIRIEPVKKLKINYTSLKRLHKMCMLIEDKKADLDLSLCKKLTYLTVHGIYRKMVLPNKRLSSNVDDGPDENFDEDEMISFGSKMGPRMLDLSKSTRARDYADQYIFPELMSKLKEGKVRTQTLIVSKKMYDNRWNTLRLLQKKGITVQVK